MKFPISPRLLETPPSFITFITDGFLADLYIPVGGNLFIDVLMMAALIGMGVTFMPWFASKYPRYPPWPSSS